MAHSGPLSCQEVGRRLERYDLRRNPRLAARFPPDQYPHTRRCAVLLPLFLSSQDGHLHVLLTQRASHLRLHASNVAFPGGAKDPTDADDIETALRESHEEIGLNPKDVKIIASLPPCFIRQCNSVFPIVGFIPEEFTPAPNPEEVAKVFSVPLWHFVCDRKLRFNHFEMLGATIRYPFLEHIEGDTTLKIWGATCAICVQVSRAVLGPFTRFRVISRDGEVDVAVRRLLSECGLEDDEENVFADFEILYHVLCKNSRPDSRL